MTTHSPRQSTGFARWRIVAVLLVAALLTPSITYVIGPIDRWRVIDVVAAWCYAVVLVAVIGMLAGFRLPAPTLPARLGWLTHVTRGQTRAGWLLAGIIALGAALALVRLGVDAPLPQAVWVKVALDAPAAAPPNVAVRYNAAADALPMRWQPYATTVVALRRPPDAKEPLHVLALTTDRGPIDIAQIMVDGKPGSSELTVTNPAGALLMWPGPTRAFTLTLAGQGATDVLWTDQRTQVQLGAQPAQVTLKQNGWQGWALLPPEHITQLALTVPSDATLRQVDVLSASPQTWDAATLVPDHNATVQLANLYPLNPPNYQQQLLATLGLAALLFGALVVLAFGARRLGQIADHYEAVETPIGTWLRRTDTWNIGWIMLGVWLIALAWHLTYTFAVPWDYTNDSPGYYSFGQQLLHTQRFANILSERTPGYPIFLALVMIVAGNSGIALVVLQHLGLTLLAPLAVGILDKRVSRIGALLAGVAVAILPSMSMLANMIHTEALYTVFTSAALLLYASYGERLRGLLGIGVLLGAATMLRPTALLALVALIGWLLLRGWCAPAGGRVQRFALTGSTALIMGYATLAAPWHIHLALVRQTLDLSGGRATITRWASVVQQRRIDAALPALRPDRAFWDLWMDPRYQPYTDPFPFFGVDSEMMTSVGPIELAQINGALGNQRVLNETIREADAANPQRLRTNQLVALYGNLLFRWNISSDFLTWTELSGWFLHNWQVAPPPPATPPDGQLATTLAWMLYRPLPEHSWVRALCLRISMFGFNRWVLASVPALFTLVFLLIYRPWRGFVPCWLYWIGLALSSSIIGMPAQRYIVVAEPLLYVLAALGIGALLMIRPRRVVRTNHDAGAI